MRMRILIGIVLALGYACSAATAALKTEKGLVAHYALDDAKGTIARDRGPNGHHGTLRGASWVRTMTGRALRFKATTDHVDLGEALAGELTGDMTLAAWVKLMPPYFPDAVANWTIIDCEKNKVSGFILRVDGLTGKLLFRTSRPGEAGGAWSATALRNHEYHHVVLVREGDSVSLTLDGTSSGTLPLEKHAPPTLPLKIGSRHQSFIGLIDDVKIYGRALSQKEILTQLRKGARLRGKDLSATHGASALYEAMPRDRRAGTAFFKGHGDPLAFQKSRKALRLANREVGITFARGRRTVALSRIYGVKSGEDFISDHLLARNQPFWKIQLRLENGRGPSTTLTNFSRSKFSYKLDRQPAAITLRLRWKDVDLPKEPAAIDVEVLVTVREDDPLSRWRINVVNRSKAYGLWEVICPWTALRPIGGDPQTNMLTVPKNRGSAMKAPFLKNLNYYHGMRYPGGYEMQFHALYDARSRAGLYVAAYDGKGYTKQFFWQAHPKEKVITNGIGHVPANRGYPAADFRMDYDVAIGPFTGDWYDACQIYREWALKQKWCAGGPLATRTDVPRWYKEAPIALVTYSSQGEKDLPILRDRILALRRFIGIDMPINWYRWRVHLPDKTHYNNPTSPWRVPQKRATPCGNIHDGNYPVMPALPSFAATCKALRSSGIHVKPYVCARIYDQGLNENAPFAVPAKPNVVRDLMGEIMPGESKRTGVAWGICYHTPWWQQRMAETARELIRNENAHGIYFDTFGGGEVACYDTTHGHAHGGGNSPYAGAWKIGGVVRAALKQVDPEAVMSGEHPSETAIDLLDGFLCGRAITPFTVPMMAAVYGDYIVRYSLVVRFESKSFYMKCASLFTSGA